MTLNTEASAKWNAVAAEDWIIVAEGQSGVGPGAIILVVSPFASPSGSRRGSVAIAGKQILVNQMGYEASVDPLVSEINSRGGTNEVSVRVPLGAIWEAIARAPWITIIGEQTRNGSGSITFVTSPNSGAPRSGTIVIAGREVTVLQAAVSEGDTDGDDLPDAWEIEHFGSLVQDGAGDADQDGFSNLIEFKVGTRPNDKASKPDTTVSIWPAVEIGFPTMKELRYQLQGSDDLQTWINLKELIPGTGAPVSTFERVQDGRMKFYRVVVK